MMKAQILVDQDGIHVVAFMDVIEHEGKFWLVPEWFENTVLKERRPVRLIGLAKLVHSRTKGSPEFVVEFPIPKSVLFDEAILPELECSYDVLEAPDIRFPIGVAH